MFVEFDPRSGIRSACATGLLALALTGCATAPPGAPPGGAPGDAPEYRDDGLVDDFDAAAVAALDQRQSLRLEQAERERRELDLQGAAAALWLERAERLRFANRRHLAELEQARAEARVVAAIDASIDEIRHRADAWYRLRAGMRMQPVYNARVEAQLKWYLDHPGYMQRVMERARPILPFVLDELERRDLPTEIALLPIVESAYQAFAYSHGRASGMWQIIPGTGRFLGLKQNWWYDGRRDIIESTRAAITYLEDLARQFDGDWEKALASYNAGPGRIRSAVRYNRKHGRPTDFWSLTRFRRETRDYVPKLFALKEIFTNPDKYGLDLVPVGNQVAYEIVELDGQIDLALAAELAGITVNELYQLNPAFNRWATAPEGPHRLLLPRGQAEHFQREIARIPESKRINWVRHKIRNGETLSHISRRYRTTVALIKQVNNLRGNGIRAGRHLMVPTATRSMSSYTLSESSRTARIQNTNRKGTRREHIVRPGQSLWSISRQYGVTTLELAKWNAMAPRDTLRVGQKLVVWTDPELARTVSLDTSRPDNRLHALRYTVRKGDSLHRIADRFNISVADIKRWNKIGKYLQPGQKLKLYIDITSQSG